MEGAALVRKQAADDEYVGWIRHQLLRQQRYSAAQDEQQCYYVGIETPMILDYVKNDVIIFSRVTDGFVSSFLTPFEHVPTVNVGIPHCGGVDTKGDVEGHRLCDKHIIRWRSHHPQ